MYDPRQLRVKKKVLKPIQDEGQKSLLLVSPLQLLQTSELAPKNLRPSLLALLLH